MSVLRKNKTYKTRKINEAGEFKSIYRFNEENVNILTDIFLTENDETRGKAVSPKQQMQIFLRCLADPGFQISVGQEECVHRTTVCKIFKKVIKIYIYFWFFFQFMLRDFRF